MAKRWQYKVLTFDLFSTKDDLEIDYLLDDGKVVRRLAERGNREERMNRSYPAYQRMLSEDGKLYLPVVLEALGMEGWEITGISQSAPNTRSVHFIYFKRDFQELE